MDYNYKNSLFHRISEFHYFSELLDNKVDTMLEHPWTQLQVLIKEKWLTQKAFSSILWKKVSEVNELLKWKRNITIQRDYLLHQTLWTPMKYWILKQVDYDYSLLNIDETDQSSWASACPAELGEDLMWETEELNTQDSSSQAPQNDNIIQEENNTQENPIQELDAKDDEDLKNRAKIFRTF